MSSAMASQSALCGARSTSARIEHAVDSLAVPGLAVLRVVLLPVGIGVVAHEEIPRHRRVLGCLGVKRRHVVVVGQALAGGIDGVAALKLARIAPRLEEHHAVPRLGETGRQGAAAGTGAHHHELGIGSRRRHESQPGAPADGTAVRPGRNFCKVIPTTTSDAPRPNSDAAR